MLLALGVTIEGVPVLHRLVAGMDVVFVQFDEPHTPLTIVHPAQARATPPSVESRVIDSRIPFVNTCFMKPRENINFLNSFVLITFVLKSSTENILW